MHSSILRGSDFHLSWAGRDVSHEDFFRDHTRQTRVGLLAPDGTEGIGAVTLAMACVTAFYDDLRKEGGELFAQQPVGLGGESREERQGVKAARAGAKGGAARRRLLWLYPDFFTFQRRQRVANYGSFDFWPDKDVRVADDRNATIAAIADRAINVLLVPESPAVERQCDPVQSERLRRTLKRCFVYSRHGEVADADLVIRCAVEPFSTYVANVLRSVDEPMPDWLENQDGKLAQSFREASIDDTLMRV